MKMITSHMLALLAIIAAVNGEEASDAVTEFANGNHLLSSKIYQEVIKTQSGNFVASPFSAEVVLALTKEGAKGKSAEEFISALNLPSSAEKLRKAISTLPTKHLGSKEKPYKILSANKVYVDNQISIKEDFKTIATKYYNADIENLDLSKTEESAQKINDWVAENTNNIIKKIFEPENLDQVVAVLVNALYFKGYWQDEFNARYTSREKFFKSENNSVLVDTMRQTSSQSLYEDQKLNAKFLEMKYKGNDCTMTIVLPNKVDGLSELENNPEIFKRPDYDRRQLVDISLPKFKIETTIKFIPILKQLGLTQVFKRGEADLSGIAGEKGDIYIDQVIQKAFIAVTEKGTEAGAVTAETFIPLMLPREFIADHPFIFYIKFRDVILMLGRYSSPQ